MKTILGFVLVLLLSTQMWPQSGCVNCLHGTNSGCVDREDCGSLTGCTSYNFTVCSTDDYQLRAYTTCSPGNCAHCAACVSVYDAMPPLTLIGSCSTIGELYCEQGVSEGCVNDDCPQMRLEAGKPYVMHVCLIACPTEVNGCEGCTNDCTAHGCIRNSSGICC